MSKRIKHLPLNRFLLVTTVGYRQPDPVPKELMAAAILFLVTALIAF